MKSLRMKILLIMSGMVFGSSVWGHTAGVHGGGVMQQVMHILQSADHLFIILALGVAVSLLVHWVKNKQGE